MLFLNLPSLSLLYNFYRTKANTAIGRQQQITIEISNKNINK
jgi:hypothetical protein